MFPVFSYEVIAGASIFVVVLGLFIAMMVKMGRVLREIRELKESMKFSSEKDVENEGVDDYSVKNEIQVKETTGSEEDEEFEEIGTEKVVNLPHESFEEEIDEDEEVKEIMDFEREFDEEEIENEDFESEEEFDFSEKKTIEEEIASANNFDIKLNRIKESISENEAIELLKKLGMSEGRSVRTVENLPLVVKRDIPSERVKRIYEALDRGFEIDLIPSG